MFSVLCLSSKEADEQNAQFLRISWKAELRAVVSVQGNVKVDWQNGVLVERVCIKRYVREYIKWTCVRIHLLYLLGICLLAIQVPFITVLYLNIIYSLGRYIFSFCVLQFTFYYLLCNIKTTNYIIHYQCCRTAD